jgi:hypothetical protein
MDMERDDLGQGCLLPGTKRNQKGILDGFSYAIAALAAHLAFLAMVTLSQFNG